MRRTALFALLASLLPVSRCVCSTTDPATEGQQYEAFKDFSNLFLTQRDLDKAFNEYIPGEYINHNPDVQSGRENALNYLRPIWTSTPVVPAAVFFGQGFGLIHYKVERNGTSIAIMDRYRLNGTCIVEHWDLRQTITGNEANPIAFF
ncbi:hypothetical protein CPB83DRAFT_895691 [Crepidotus variabilis]|uniref:SnoaL-like domain-containing protein n=1 Tax=Crepidotus variabilis TaxID=179855 RepID=A0A9P6EDK2_9AGAR|nr:hypothetical protein CPB83DRAFT_895691 [Crepidotus variabilis]